MNYGQNLRTRRFLPVEDNVKYLYRIEENMAGRVALVDEEEEMFRRIAMDCKPNLRYIEIGTLFGGSAVLMGLILKELYPEEPWEIWCIDPMDSYYGKGTDIVSGSSLSKDVFWSNIRRFGVPESKVQVLPYLSTDERLLENLPDKNVDILFVDGDHTYKGVWNDLELAMYHMDCPRYIVVHDYDTRHKDVVDAVHNFIGIRADYYPVFIGGLSIVLKGKK